MGKSTLLYSTLLYPVRKQLDVSWSEYVLLDMVYHLSAGSGTGWTTMNKYAMAETMGMSFKGWEKLRDRMVERDLLVVSENARGMQPSAAYRAVVNQYEMPGEQSSQKATRKSELSSSKSELSSVKGEQSIGNNNDNNVIDAATASKSRRVQPNNQKTPASFDSTEAPEWWVPLVEAIEPLASYSPSCARLAGLVADEYGADDILLAAQWFKKQFGAYADDDFYSKHPEWRTVSFFLGQTKGSEPKLRVVHFLAKAKTAGMVSSATKKRQAMELDAKTAEYAEANAALRASNVAKLKEMNRLKSEGMPHDLAKAQAYGK